MTTLLALTLTGAGSTGLTSHQEAAETWATSQGNGSGGTPVVTPSGLSLVTAGQTARYACTPYPAWSIVGNADYGLTLTMVWGGQTGDAVIGPQLRTHIAAASGYSWVYRKNDGAMRLLLGGGGQVGSNVTFTPTVSESYKLTLIANGTTISGRVQRLSDNQWLKSDGTWQAGQIDAVSGTDASASAAWYPGIYFYEASTNTSFLKDLLLFDLATGATNVTLSGPTSGTAGVASSNFTVGVSGGAIGGSLVVTPDDNGDGGSFTPTSVTLSSGTTTGTFTYTPATVGAKSVGVTNNQGLTNPADITYTASSSAATAVTLSGPGTCTVGAASSNFTVGANGAITGTVTVTPTDGSGGGSFSPPSVNISAGSPTATFTYTAASIGTKTIGVSNNGSLSNPSSLSVTASTAVPYTVVSFTEPRSGQACQLLVPNSYTSGVPAGLVIYFHGQGESYDTISLTTDSKAGTISALTAAGIWVAACMATVAGMGAGATWGNDASCKAHIDMGRYLIQTYAFDRIVLWGASMGGCTSLNVMATGRLPVHGWVGTAPASNLANMRTVYGTNIDNAYGVTGSGAITYSNQTWGYDPHLMPSYTWRHIPMRMYASPSDTTVSKAANADAFAALVRTSARECTVVPATGGHIDSSHFDPSDTLAFVQRCFDRIAPLAMPAGTKTVTVTLHLNDAGTVAASTAVKWRWFDSPEPTVPGPCTDIGTATTNGAGVLSITVHTNLSVGQLGRLEVATDDGTLSAAWRAVGGPIAVA